MDANEAIGILRGDETAYYTPSMLDEAKKMGAEALEAWAWVERTGCQLVPAYRPKMWGALSFGDNGRLGYGPTPLAAVIDAMQKEGKG